MGDSKLQRLIELERKFLIDFQGFEELLGFWKLPNIARYVQVYNDFDDNFKRLRVEADKYKVKTVFNSKMPVTDYQGAAIETEKTTDGALFVQNGCQALVKYRSEININSRDQIAAMSIFEEKFGKIDLKLYVDYLPKKKVFYLESELIFEEAEFEVFKNKVSQEEFANLCNQICIGIDVTGNPAHSARANAEYHTALEINDEIRTQESFHRIQKLKNEGFIM